MTCDKVQRRLAGYLDDGNVSAARSSERVAMRQHLESCENCREELQRYRKMAVLMSRVPRAVPPADLAVKIKVAASQAQATQDWRGRWQHIKDRAEILLDNVFRPLTVPATGVTLAEASVSKDGAWNRNPPYIQTVTGNNVSVYIPAASAALVRVVP